MDCAVVTPVLSLFCKNGGKQFEPLSPSVNDLVEYYYLRYFRSKKLRDRLDGAHPHSYNSV